MKALKTIRKMPPLARDIAKLQRAIHSLEQRCDRLVKFADEIEQEGRTLRRENAELRGRQATKPSIDKGFLLYKGLPFCERWPETPDGEAIAQVQDQVQGCDSRD